VDRHAILRTSFAWEGFERPLQLVWRRVSVPLAYQDWRGIEALEQERRWQALLAAEQDAGMRVTEPPLMRLTLVRMEEAVYRLAWSFHHIISDGWSFPLLTAELFELFAAASLRRPARLELSRPYRDYIAWLERQDRVAAEAFWRTELAGFSAPTLLDGDRPGHGRLYGEPYGESQLRLPTAASSELSALARSQQLTLNTLFQGAWALLLGHYSGERNVVFGAVTSGRPAELPGVESMIGVFINSLPVRVEIEPRAELLPWLRRLQARQAAVRQFEHSPLARVQGWSDVPRGEALFTTLLAFENYPVESSLYEHGAPVEVGDVQFHERTHYPLTLVTSPGLPLTVKVMFDRRIFAPTAVERILGHLANLLIGFAAQPDRLVAELHLLTAAERHQLLCEWNDTAAPYDRTACIHQLFERQVRRNPGAVAVRSSSSSVSYGEISRHANRLAHNLAAGGIGRGDVVAVYLERCPGMVSAVLGVLKAGAAYVPLEIGTPPTRCAWILGALGVRVLITHASLLGSLAEMVPRSGASLEVICLDAAGDVAPREAQAVRGTGAGLAIWDDLAGRPEEDPPPRAG
ncbi:MAG TPA: condensation domain-containing protein, partial [Thermoanaerobaculia bacterium]